ncbi:MAG TPA: phosphatase PAP2 family protein [Candidatus Binatus sp.]|nr:phosphatase PAP2 family protein [Candidatus Binatus sp.]
MTKRSRVVATAIVVAGVVALTISQKFADQIARDNFFSLTLAGCTIIFLSVRSRREFPQAAGAGAVLLGLQMFILQTPFRVLTAFALLGLGSWLLLAVRRIWSTGNNDDRVLLQDATLPPLLFLLLGYLGSGPLVMTARLHPKTLDWFLYSFDQSLGTQLSFRFGQVVLLSRLLTRVTLGVYYALPIAIMFTYARQLVRNRNLAMMAFLAFAVAGPLGVVFYNLVPAGGPANLFGAKFPFDPLTTEQLRQIPMEALTIAGPRNAFPSLHLAWALLIGWYAEGLSRWTKIVFFVFVLGTVGSTLALGEHYFIDLVTAFPFALMIQAACALNVSFSDSRRFVPLLTGALLMVAWMVLLRWGLPLVWISPIVPWTLVAGTIATTLWLQARLRTVLFQPVEGAPSAVES